MNIKVEVSVIIQSGCEVLKIERYSVKLRTEEDRIRREEPVLDDGMRNYNGLYPNFLYSCPVMLMIQVPYVCLLHIEPEPLFMPSKPGPACLQAFQGKISDANDALASGRIVLRRVLKRYKEVSLGVSPRVNVSLQALTDRYRRYMSQSGGSTTQCGSVPGRQGCETSRMSERGTVPVGRMSLAKAWLVRDMLHCHFRHRVH